MGNECHRFSSRGKPPCSLLCRDASMASDPQAAARSDEGDLLLLNAPRLGFAEAHFKLHSHIQH